MEVTSSLERGSRALSIINREMGISSNQSSVQSLLHSTANDYIMFIFFSLMKFVLQNKDGNVTAKILRIKGALGREERVIFELHLHT